MIGQVGQFQRGAIRKHHDRDRPFAPAIITYADDGDLAHLR